MYTGNQITLSEATRRITGLLPKRLTEKQMDAYLDASFVTYKGVIDLIQMKAFLWNESDQGGSQSGSR